MKSESSRNYKWTRQGGKLRESQHLIRENAGWIEIIANVARAPLTARIISLVENAKAKNFYYFIVFTEKKIMLCLFLRWCDRFPTGLSQIL